MIKSFIEAWEKNNYQLRLWLEYDVDIEDIEYADIVKAIFERVINPSIEREWEKYDIEKMTIVNDGDYQGTLIFLIPKNVYQPDAYDYIVTHNYYGSCSGCDALQSYQFATEGKARIDGIMMIALHLVEKMKPLYGRGK